MIPGSAANVAPTWSPPIDDRRIARHLPKLFVCVLSTVFSFVFVFYLTPSSHETNRRRNEIEKERNATFLISRWNLGQSNSFSFGLASRNEQHWEINCHPGMNKSEMRKEITNFHQHFPRFHFSFSFASSSGNRYFSAFGFVDFFARFRASRTE